jgi:hypothetical protein
MQARRLIPEDSTVHTRRYENLKSNVRPNFGVEKAFKYKHEKQYCTQAVKCYLYRNKLYVLEVENVNVLEVKRGLWFESLAWFMF